MEICERNSIGKNLKHSYYYHPQKNIFRKLGVNNVYEATKYILYAPG